MDESVRYSVVVPCYRSKATLGELVARLDKVLRQRGGVYEILLVHDASPDETWLEIERLASAYPAVVGVDLMANTGQFRATLCGLAKSQGEIVVTMDDDLQHPPEELPKLLDRLESHPGLDCVIGQYEGKKHDRVRNFGTQAYARLAKMLYNKPLHLEMTSFRAMRRSLAHLLPQHRSAKPMIEILILRSTKRILNVPVAHHPRKVGTSGYNLRKLARVVLDNIIGTSTLPMQMVGWFGAFCVATSVLLGLCFALSAALGFGAPAGAATMLLITFFSGTILGALGLLGEYAGRIIEEISGAPRYVIRQVARHAPAPSNPRIQEPVLHG